MARKAAPENVRREQILRGRWDGGGGGELDPRLRGAVGGRPTAFDSEAYLSAVRAIVGQLTRPPRDG